jgi:hypothetical protein
MKKQQNKQYVEIPSHLKRLNYFSGQLLTQADLQTEQSYFIERNRLHNIYLLGYGVVSGLDVSVSKDSPDSVMVSPGFAIDSRGNEIILPAAVQAPLPEKVCGAYLILYWAERETDFVPMPKGKVASRVEEYAILKIKIEDPATKLKPRKKIESHDGIVLARLKKTRDVWKLDKRFRVRRVNV